MNVLAKPNRIEKAVRGIAYAMPMITGAILLAAPSLEFPVRETAAFGLLFAASLVVAIEVAHRPGKL